MAYDAAYWAIVYLLYQQETGPSPLFLQEDPTAWGEADGFAGLREADGFAGLREADGFAGLREAEGFAGLSEAEDSAGEWAIDGLSGDDGWTDGPDRLWEGGGEAYSGQWEEQETADLLQFVQQALHELSRRTGHIPLSSPGLGDTPVCESGQDRSLRADRLLPVIRVSRTYRVFVGDAELKLRPMARSVLLLFLRHPEGIALKRIGDYRKEMVFYYRQVMRGDEPEMAERRVARLIDTFNNELNVNIARVNAAMNTLVRGDGQVLYHIQGESGRPKTLPLDRSLVVWEA